MKREDERGRDRTRDDEIRRERTCILGHIDFPSCRFIIYVTSSCIQRGHVCQRIELGVFFCKCDGVRLVN